jgi:hypothetical protein
MTDMTVSQTILSELGGNRFIAMTGSKNFVGSDDALSFKLAKYMRIVLTPMGKRGTGRCEKIDLETWSNFGLEKNRVRMTYKRPLGPRYTSRFRRSFSRINFFTFSRRSNPRSCNV